jgi:ankyrin repeat protein
MADLQIKYPSFYSDLSKFLEPYGDLEKSKEIVLKAPCVGVQTEHTVDNIITFDSLATCIASGNVQELKMLLDSQSNSANLRDAESGLPIILYALRYRPLRLEVSELMIKLLVSSGANLEVVDFLTGMNALHFLLHVSIYIDNSKDPFLLSDLEQSSPLSSLIFQMAQFLAENGCVADLPDSRGNRPLHYACQIGDWNTVRCLVHEYNVDLFKPNSNGKIPLDYAISEEIKDFLTAEMNRKNSSEESGGFILSEKSIKNLQIESLQRIQGYLLHAFEDASAALSEELAQERIYETQMTKRMADEPFISNSAVNTTLEARVMYLQDELQKSQDESSEAIQNRDQNIFNLETEMESLRNTIHTLQGQLEESNVLLEAKKQQISDMESQYDIVKKSLVKATETSVTLSSQLKDIERSRSQQVTSFQTRIQELENLAHRKDEVIRQMGETNRFIETPRTINSQTESSKLNQLDLHSNILKANLEAVVEDLRVLKSSNHEKDAEEIKRLEEEREGIEQQMSQVMNELSSVMESPQYTPRRSSRDFMHLEELLGQLQVNSVEVSPPYTPDGSPRRESEGREFSNRMSYRMSTVINKEECDLDPTLVNRLLDAAKRKIQRLKRRCETDEDEIMELRNQVEEKDIHIKDTYLLLQASNGRAAEAESKLSRRGAEQDKFNLKLRDIENERLLDLNCLRKTIEEFIGPSENDEDDEVLRGILGMVHALFLDLDPALFGSLPPHLVNPTADDMIQLADFSEDFKVDSGRYNSYLLKVLNDVAARIKEYLNHLGIALGRMKTENKKFVKEIMKLKKEAVVKSLVSNVRDSVNQKPHRRLDFSENEIRKHIQKREEPIVQVSPNSSYSSTPLRPVRMNRQSHQSPTALSDVSVASGLSPEASDILDSLRRLKVEISYLHEVEDPPVEAKNRLMELRQEYRNLVKRFMEVSKMETSIDASSTTSQELKDRLKQVSFYKC